MRVRLLSLILLGVASWPWLSAQVPAGPASVAEQYLFSAANAERTQRGLPPLRWDDALYRAASGHAREMASRRSISHGYPGEPELASRGRQAGARFSRIAENVAESPDAVRMHDAWMRSEGHRANLLDPEVTAVGIRVISRQGELYAVEDFARSVVDLSLAEQESTVEASIGSYSGIVLLPPSEDSRRTCGLGTGYAGFRQPGFVMRYTATDLSKLPETLRVELAARRYRQATVGACDAERGEDFAAYRIAVILFP
jgi:hypothetical protein